MCNCYIPPQNSVIFKQNKETPFDILQKEIELYDTKGDLILIGDFNSRTGNIQETIHEVRDITDNERQDINVDTSIPTRYNEDYTVNQFGKQLLNTIEQAHMVILNGRTLGDIQGSKTCHKLNGSSTVDYIIVSSGIWNNVTTFRVLEEEWFTDHSPLSCHMRLLSSRIKPMVEIN